jgi:hypothetical protein
MRSELGSILLDTVHPSNQIEIGSVSEKVSMSSTQWLAGTSKAPRHHSAEQVNRDLQAGWRMP